MKTVLIIILILVLSIGAGYFVLPLLIQKETAVLKSEIQDVKQRLERIEKSMEIAPLQPDADFQKVIQTVNALHLKIVPLEDSFKKSAVTLDETMKKQNTAHEEALRKQAETIEKITKETQSKLQEIMFDATMALIRGHILKARVEISSRNGCCEDVRVVGKTGLCGGQKIWCAALSEEEKYIPVPMQHWIQDVNRELSELKQRIVVLEATVVKKNGALVDEIHEDEARIARLETFRSQVLVITSMAIFFIPIIIILFDHLFLDR